MIARLASETFDVLVIGGGATGLGVAVDASSRGYRTALVEASDFASSTSSRSTKLIHGGVRYLAQGNIALVREALYERTLLRRNAPHVVSDVPFIVPAYSWIQLATLNAGLKIYDALAGQSEFGRTRRLTVSETLERIPKLETRRLRGAIEYHDGGFDDARLAITLARTADDNGTALANYTRAVALLRVNDRICGATVEDRENAMRFPVQARVVVNAAGIFADTVRRLDSASTPAMLRFSRGSHITVAERSLGSAQSALLIPKTSDGRVLFAVPWHEHVIVGTTDVAVDAAIENPQAEESEIAFILASVNRYLQSPLDRSEVLASFAGIRPLIARGRSSTSRLSREHVIDVSSSGLVTIAGGKWTTYRKMAQDAVDRAIDVARLTAAPCKTADLPLHGADAAPSADEPLRVYGSDAKDVEAITHREPQLAARLHSRLPYTKAQVVYAVREEMARTVDDILSRRLRATFLDTGAAAECTAVVEKLLGTSARYEKQSDYAADVDHKNDNRVNPCAQD
ncbi:MAG: glycerol-3-phosphate dehydrogenase/oxidase [Candidatus Eremiobacteraeota bacterium]|nr:glycerol-3-phosphate dehydrogenase/oxidase [Candidatus Eremiobacteraeota bacterium]